MKEKNEYDRIWFVTALSIYNQSEPSSAFMKYRVLFVLRLVPQVQAALEQAVAFAPEISGTARGWSPVSGTERVG
jgi:hypothetical protein